MSVLGALRELAEALGLFACTAGMWMVGKDVSMVVIDMNDWPSFAVCAMSLVRRSPALVKQAMKHVGD